MLSPPDSNLHSLTFFFVSSASSFLIHFTLTLLFLLTEIFVFVFF